MSTLIALREAQGDVERTHPAPVAETRDGVIAMLKTAFATTRGHWMCTAENLQLAAGVLAVLQVLGDEHPEHENLRGDLNALMTMNAALHAASSGVPVDFATVAQDLGDAERERYPLIPLFDDRA